MEELLGRPARARPGPKLGLPEATKRLLLAENAASPWDAVDATNADERLASQLFAMACTTHEGPLSSPFGDSAKAHDPQP